jgi:hypothetical protein
LLEVANIFVQLLGEKVISQASGIVVSIFVVLLQFIVVKFPATSVIINLNWYAV